MKIINLKKLFWFLKIFWRNSQVELFFRWFWWRFWWVRDELLRWRNWWKRCWFVIWRIILLCICLWKWNWRLVMLLWLWNCLNDWCVCCWFRNICGFDWWKWKVWFVILWVCIVFVLSMMFWWENWRLFSVSYDRFRKNCL